MSRGSRTTQETKRYVIRRTLEEPKTADRIELAKKIRQELLAKKVIPPAVSTLKGMISTARNRKPSPEEQPWHMGTFKQYAPSSVGLSGIMAAYRFAVQHKTTLTIREAKWIGRLSVVAQRMFVTLSDRELGPLLITWALEYAEEEIWSEVSKEPFDTTKLDSWVAMGDHMPSEWELGARLSLMQRQLRRKLVGNVAKQQTVVFKPVLWDRGLKEHDGISDEELAGPLGEEKRAFRTKMTELIREMPDFDEDISLALGLSPKRIAIEVRLHCNVQKPDSSEGDNARLHSQERQE